MTDMRAQYVLDSEGFLLAQRPPGLLPGNVIIARNPNGVIPVGTPVSIIGIAFYEEVQGYRARTGIKPSSLAEPGDIFYKVTAE